MCVQTFAQFAGEPNNMFVDARDMNRHVGEVVPRGSEERRHQREVVVLALEGKFSAAFRPAFENRTQRLQVLAQARHRRFPLRAVAALDVTLHLRAEAEDEAALGQSGEIPRGRGGDHGAARKRNRNRRTHFDSLGVLGDQRGGKEAVVAGLGNPDRIEARGFSGARRSGNITQIAGRETGIELHNISLQRKFSDERTES